MADTRVQLKAEDWIRREWLPRQFNQQSRGWIGDFCLFTILETIWRSLRMQDDLLLENFIPSFFGYGSYEADTWFVGMKEGGGDKG